MTVSACLLVGWLGIALALNWAGLFQGPQGQTLEGYERLLAALCWPYVLCVLIGALSLLGAAWILVTLINGKTRGE